MSDELVSKLDLAVLDASRFSSDSPSERRAFADELLKSLSNHGFVKIVNHGISDEMVKDVFALCKKFFDLSTSTKCQIEHTPGPNPQRGWSKVGSESTAKLFNALKADAELTDNTDAKEHFDLGNPDDSQFPNRWLGEDDVPSMQAFLEDFYERCHQISMQLLEAMELAMELPQGTFTSKCKERADELRLNHYPALNMSKAPQDINRVWPHTDLGIITCLFQDSVGGLEIEDRKNAGRFEGVAPGAPGELVVNISETFERWTNGRIKAGVHDVRLPPTLKSSRKDGEDLIVPERFSIPYFVKADRQACVGALPEFVSAEYPSTYPAMTALEYHMQRVAKAY